MKKSIRFSAISLLLGVALFTQALTIKGIWKEPMGPQSYPLAVSIMMIAAAGLNLLIDLRKARRNVNPEKSADGDTDVPKLKRFLTSSPLLVALTAVLYVLGLNYVGFYISTFLFMVLSTSIIAYLTEPADFRKTFLMRALPLALVIVAILYFGVRFLHIYLPQGGLLW